jgi:hypothetical protein
MKSLNKILAIGLMALAGLNAMAQTSADKKAKKAAETARQINGKDFLFNANYVTPARGGGRSLTSEYDLTVHNDTIVAYLPYFGVAHMAPPYGSTDNSINFKWTKFTYEVTPDKKNGFDILIKPMKQDLGDANAVQSLRLSVGAGGYATLQVNNMNRDPITFQGTIEHRRVKKDEQTGL